jgi:hypothetical protein
MMRCYLDLRSVYKPATQSPVGSIRQQRESVPSSCECRRENENDHCLLSREQHIDMCQ